MQLSYTPITQLQTDTSQLQTDTTQLQSDPTQLQTNTTQLQFYATPTRHTNKTQLQFCTTQLPIVSDWCNSVADVQAPPMLLMVSAPPWPARYCSLFLIYNSIEEDTLSAGSDALASLAQVFLNAAGSPCKLAVFRALLVMGCTIAVSLIFQSTSRIFVTSLMDHGIDLTNVYYLYKGERIQLHLDDESFPWPTVQKATAVAYTKDKKHQ